MTARQIIAPTTYGVTVAEAKKQSRVLNNAEDDLVELYLGAALAYVEKTTGRAFQPQTWEVVVDAFSSEALELPVGPVTSVTEVTYVDADGETQTIDPTTFEVDTASTDGWIVTSGAWPSGMATINAVRAVYLVGGGDMPRDIKQAILLLAAHWYANREAAGPAMQEIPLGVETILSLHRRIYV